MKPVVLLLVLMVAAAGFAEEKKVNPRAFRMPSKKTATTAKKPEPEKKAAEARPVATKPVAEGSKDAPVAQPATVEQQPPVEPPSPVAPLPPVQPEKALTSPTAFRLPDVSATESPASAATEPVNPAAKEVVKEPKAALPAFTLPGAKPVPAKKKNPVTFRMPAKKKSE